MATHKLVINRAYGGFQLSPEAIERYARLKGLELERRETGMTWGARVRVQYYHHGRRFDGTRIPRHDPALVDVVEALGERASGPFARLSVETTQASQYRIVTYDGYETVETPDSIVWVTLDEDEADSRAPGEETRSAGEAGHERTR